MKVIYVKVMRSVLIAAACLAIVTCLHASVAAADTPDFTKPYIGVKPTTGQRPLLVLLLGPDDPRMWDQVNVYALKSNGYIGQTIVRVDSTGHLDNWATPIAVEETRRFTSAPAVMNSPDGNLQSVFALADDGYIYQSYHNRISGSSDWQNWSSWSALPKTMRFGSAPAVMNSPDGNLASVFALGQDGYIYQIVYARTNSNGWGDWQPIPGSRRFKAAPAVINSPDGRLAEVFALADDGYIYQINFRRGTSQGWGDWQLLPQSVRFQAAPAVINMPDENLTSVFALGEDGYLYHVNYSRHAGKGWSNWERLPHTQKYLSAPAVISRQAHLRTPEYYHQLIFDAPKSVRGYYWENSYRQFTFSKAYITPWLTAQDDLKTSDWDESSLRFFHFYDEQHNYERKSAWAIRQVERLTSFKFKDYDTNRDGKVTTDELAILWIYPGDSDARARGVNPALVKENYMSAGVEIGLLARGAAGMDLTTMAHELGHEVLHLEDLYPAPGFTGVGRFSLMSFTDAGSHLDPWSKIKLGWLNPQVVSHDGWYDLAAVEASPTAYILHDPAHGTQEYFIVENRWPGNSFEANLPDRGLAIWHIDERFQNDPGDWGRKTIQLEWAGPEGDDNRALWDGAEPHTPASTYPVWHQNTTSGIGISSIPAAGSNVRVFFDIPD